MLHDFTKWTHLQSLGNKSHSLSPLLGMSPSRWPIIPNILFRFRVTLLIRSCDLGGNGTRKYTRMKDGPNRTCNKNVGISNGLSDECFWKTSHFHFLLSSLDISVQKESKNNVYMVVYVILHSVSRSRFFSDCGRHCFPDSGIKISVIKYYSSVYPLKSEIGFDET